MHKFQIGEEIDEEHVIEVFKELELSSDIGEKKQEQESFDNSFDEAIKTSASV